MFEQRKRRNARPLFAVAIVLTVVVFIIDLQVELGVSTGILYIAVVGAAFASCSRRFLVAMACTTTALLAIGYFLSAPGGEGWKVLVNRVLAIFAIWTVTFLYLRAIRLVDLLHGDESKIQNLVLEASPAGMVMVNRQGAILLVNRAAEELFGYTRQELLGQPIEVLVPSKYRDRHPEHRYRFFADSSARPMGGDVTVFGRHKSGLDIPVDIGLNPVEVDNEPCVLSTIIDLREQKRVEHELQRQTKQLARANEDLQEFANIASHDLKSPLRAINNLAKWIVEDVGDALPEASQTHLGQLQSRVSRMESLLNDLLDYSRAGRILEDAEIIDCSSLVNEILATLDIPVEFRVDVDQYLPTLHGRRTALRQVLMNLIGNAVKHHDRGDGCVTLRAVERKSTIEFIIEDDGPGIDPEFHEQAFMPFRTLQPRDEVEGTGLGLAIVQRLVENEGGSIQLASEKGKGARFRVTWPKQIAAETALV